ncbi:hypothetical protein NAC44_19235 [Allorhizobium sp. BGMRC 0089]|uniref:hypothetical protein n=1 Tax=Allorhizobium sonneratiae TaxID=2934936 RepID=UPI00203402B2|nr:hypothetical protein [Allorhizobium sonneratiae]MCM2294464.1 hypothetical protein [Allorhizobium sonneratiae]
MAWTFKAVAKTQAGEVETELLTLINDLTDKQKETFKSSASDMKGGDARGIIIYDKDGRDFQGFSTSNYVMKTYKTNTDYENLYNEVVNHINSLTLKQAQNARTVFTNAQAHDATIAIYYPAS